MTPNKLKQLWSKGKPTINGWCSIGNTFTAEIMAAQGYDFDHRRRAARRARLFEPVADASGDARFRRRSDGACAVAGTGHHHEGARRRRVWRHLPDGEQRATGGGVRQLHAVPAARATQLRPDARLVRRRRGLRRPREQRNAGLRDDRDRRGHGEPVVDRRDAGPRRTLCGTGGSHARPRAGSPSRRGSIAKSPR